VDWGRIGFRILFLAGAARDTLSKRLANFLEQLDQKASA
jgi:hypothetical protein